MNNPEIHNCLEYAIVFLKKYRSGTIHIDGTKPITEWCLSDETSKLDQTVKILGELKNSLILENTCANI